MKVREIKNYDLCRNGSQVWLKKFDRETEAYKTIASTDKRFETAGNLMYFEGCGLFWMSNDFNSVARYEECDGEMHFFGFIRQRPLFSEGEVFYTIEPDEKQPGEVKCLGKRLINRPDFWVFVRQKEGQLVVSYPEPHDNSRDLFMRPGRGVCHGEGISYTFEEKVFPEEVESVLEKSDMFAEICVFGVSREGGAKDGTEDIAVVVVPADTVKEMILINQHAVFVVV